MDKDQIMKHLDKAIDHQMPEAWDNIHNKIQKMEEQGYAKVVVMPSCPKSTKRNFYKRVSLVAAICLITFSTLTFTPALATIQKMYDKIFSSEHIDDTGLKMAMDQGLGQAINQPFYDKKHDITVNFQSVLTDDKETKLLLTYQSKKTNLKNYHLDIFEGDTLVNLVMENGQKKKLDNVGWGSKYYDSENNLVAQALSFESIKEYEGQDIQLEIQDLTIYSKKGKGGAIEATWPVLFKLEPSAISERETVVINKDFTFKNETYFIKQVEFSELETRVVVTGTDTGPYTDESGIQHDVMSKLEAQLLNARKIDKQNGYIVDETKSGVFLKSAGERVDPIFSKNEIPCPLGEYWMIFAPVKDRQGTTLEIGDEIKIPLTK